MDTLVPAEQRDIGYVFQDLALFPHLSVKENVTFGLQGMAREDRDARAAEVLAKREPGLGALFLLADEQGQVTELAVG